MHNDAIQIQNGINPTPIENNDKNANDTKCKWHLSVKAVASKFINDVVTNQPCRKIVRIFIIY